MATMGILFEEDEDNQLVSSMSRISITGSASGNVESDITSEQGTKRPRKNSPQFAEAIAKGRKQSTTPSKEGQPRFKFIYKGVAYVTDETCKTEISRWRIDDNIVDMSHAQLDDGMFQKASVHAIFVVDHSGSMRQPDVIGYSTRTEAVYKCLIRDFLEPQLKQMEMNANALSDAVVSLMSMSSASTLELNRVPINCELADKLLVLSSSRARFHGNYIPALESLKTLVKADRVANTKVMVFWLSDGASSDHVEEECAHGIQVWESTGRRRADGKPALLRCQTPGHCREVIKTQVTNKCVQLVQELGDLIGDDNISFTTVAFGNPTEKYEVLQKMAGVLSKGSFQKLGLEARRLVSAFTSLTSTMTQLRTSLADGSKLTLHGMKERQDRANQILGSIVKRIDGWDIYINQDVVDKIIYSSDHGRFIQIPLQPGAHGIAMKSKFFEEGAERSSFFCSEVATLDDNDDVVVVDDDDAGHEYSVTKSFKMIGHTLVAKETRHQELLFDINFHKSMAKMQARAGQLADRFNLRCQDIISSLDSDSASISFVSCVIYEVRDTAYGYPNDTAWIFAEPFLDGKFQKWNNNAGKVYMKQDEDDENEVKLQLANGTYITVHDVPQAFSHFTWSVTNGRELVCDLQGIHNLVDGFTFTDPAIHNHESRHQHGKHRTDRGSHGINQFFESHQCSPLCQMLGLKQFPMSE